MISIRNRSRTFVAQASRLPSFAGGRLRYYPSDSFSRSRVGMHPRLPILAHRHVDWGDGMDSVDGMDGEAHGTTDGRRSALMTP